LENLRYLIPNLSLKLP